MCAVEFAIYVVGIGIEIYFFFQINHINRLDDFEYIQSHGNLRLNFTVMKNQ